MDTTMDACPDALEEALNPAGIVDTVAGGPEWWGHGVVSYPTPPPTLFGFCEDLVRQGVEVANTRLEVNHTFTCLVSGVWYLRM